MIQLNRQEDNFVSVRKNLNFFVLLHIFVFLVFEKSCCKEVKLATGNSSEPIYQPSPGYQGWSKLSLGDQNVFLLDIVCLVVYLLCKVFVRVGEVLCVDNIFSNGVR